jgi:L-arabinokinase
VFVARAPGRLDVMGGIADYSGSLVLQWPIREAAFVAVQVGRRAGDPIRIVSLAPPGGSDREFTLPGGAVDELATAGYAAARDLFRATPENHWAAYVAGVLLVLARERDVRCDSGLNILVRSDVPEGKGVSSSAALEVATMQAAAQVLGLPLAGTELATLCQQAENFVVGAPCGIMDQMASALGEEDAFLALLCQPAEVQGTVRHPRGMAFWGIDSGIRHAVTGSDYTSVRTGAFMGYRILAEIAGLERLADRPSGVMQFADRLWGGYLANVDPARFEREFAPRLPASMTGAEFLARYGGTTDAVTRVQPDLSYAVRQATAHPVHEHARVRQFAELMAADRTDDATFAALGERMYASHASYSDCGLGSEGTDRLVELVRAAGPSRGLFGAKITGGGSGGTVAVLGRAEAGPVVADIARRYAAQTGRFPYVFAGSSPGACRAGVVSIRA